MRELLPVFVVLFVLVLIAIAVAAGIVLWMSGSSNRTVGTVLIYEIDPRSGHDRTSVDMEKLIDAIDRRINPGWARSAQIRRLEDGRIEIGVFGNDPNKVKRIERLLGATGTLEFRILANVVDHPALIEQAKKERGDVLRNPAGELLVWWVLVQPEQVSTLQVDSEVSTRAKKRGDREILEVLVVNDVYDVTGEYLLRAMPDVDGGGRPCVQFVFDEAGAQRFGGLTGANVPGPMQANLPGPVQQVTRKLGIILDGQLYSAPNIQTAIYKRGQITGSFTRQEVVDLATVLNAGALPAPIRKVERRAATSRRRSAPLPAKQRHTCSTR